MNSLLIGWDKGPSIKYVRTKGKGKSKNWPILLKMRTKGGGVWTKIPKILRTYN